MNATKDTVRTLRAAAVGAALLLLATACSHAPAAAPAHPAPAAPAGSTPGRASVTVPGADLRISDAVARLDAAGDGQLTMKVRNDSGVPDHLAMIGTPDGGRAVLRGDLGTNGSPTSAGILIQTGTTVAFGSAGGPQALLRTVHGVTAQHTLPMLLQFGVAGLIRLQARVSTT